jgi:uncharacterized protein
VAQRAPEVIARPGQRGLWFSSLLQTYLERDVRAVTHVKDKSSFRRFMSLVAGRQGQILNRTELAGPLGISVPTPTVGQWLYISKTTGLLAVTVAPTLENPPVTRMGPDSG